MSSFDRILILNVLKSKDYKVFENGLFNINIIGVRMNTNRPNKFDDELHVIYKDDTNSIVHTIYKITTDPGSYWLDNPSNVNGTAILKPNQYRGTYQLDLHRGRYTALCQRKPVEVYRDGNRDNILDQDEDSIDVGYFGINIHRANSSSESTNVNKWSAGCQVFANPDAYDSFISLVKKSTSIYGDNVTYTLITENDINEYLR